MYHDISMTLDKVFPGLYNDNTYVGIGSTESNFNDFMNFMSDQKTENMFVGTL